MVSFLYYLSKWKNVFTNSDKEAYKIQLSFAYKQSAFL